MERLTCQHCILTGHRLHHCHVCRASPSSLMPLTASTAAVGAGNVQREIPWSARGWVGRQLTSQSCSAGFPCTCTGPHPLLIPPFLWCVGDHVTYPVYPTGAVPKAPATNQCGCRLGSSTLPPWGCLGRTRFLLGHARSILLFKLTVDRRTALRPCMQTSTGSMFLGTTPPA